MNIVALTSYSAADPENTMLWAIFALMMLLALWWVLPALLQKNPAPRTGEPRAANLLIYQDQFRELDSDLANGLISEEQHQQDKDELERRLLDDVKPEAAASVSRPGIPKLAYAVGAFIPIAGLTLYLAIGNSKSVTGQPSAMTANAPFANQSGQMTQQQIEANVAKLANRLQQNPGDLQGWLMLARSYTSLERYSDAAAAYEHATALDRNNADLWVDYAQALAMSNNRQVDEKLTNAINRALQIDPKNGKALAIAGSAAFASGEYAKAADYWQKLLPMIPPNAPEAKAVSDQIARAKELAAAKTK